jgi:hypothetical protein
VALGEESGVQVIRLAGWLKARRSPRTKRPRLIEAQSVQNLKPVIDAVHNSRG